MTNTKHVYRGVCERMQEPFGINPSNKLRLGTNPPGVCGLCSFTLHQEAWEGGDGITDHRQVIAFSQHQPWQSHLAGLVLAGSCLAMQVFHSHHCGVISAGSLVSELPFARPGTFCVLWHVAHTPSLCRL